MYVETGNGTFDTTLNAAGFPIYGDYGDSFIKIALDSTTSQNNQNINGWGLKVVDYFTPQNQAALFFRRSGPGIGRAAHSAHQRWFDHHRQRRRSGSAGGLRKRRNDLPYQPQ